MANIERKKQKEKVIHPRITMSANESIDVDWSVNKFGGTSVANASCMIKVRNIISSELTSKKKRAKMAVVVSAMGGKPKVTDMLLSAVTLAANGNHIAYTNLLQTIRDKHTDAISDLNLSWGQANSIVTSIDSDISNLKDLLKAVSLMQYENERLRELVSGYGEVWSSQILCALLNQSEHSFRFVNARDVIIIDETPETGPEIVWDRCEQNLEAVLNDIGAEENLVITGFIASTVSGIATTLKRDGSDYSASIFGKLLKANSINIWTDVDGVLSADPRKVPEAKVLSDVSFNEAMELAYFGAKVIHPKTMLPAVDANIPIFIKNTFNPSFAGTRIFQSNTATQDRLRCVCGFATVDDIALLNVEGSGMIGVPGVAQRLFGSLHKMGISVILISQASSEHSISVAIDAKHSSSALEGVKETFYRELQSRHITSIDCLSPCCIVAAVGDGMSKTVGVAGRFFSALGSASINILAIAQGCSERNISCVVKAEDSARALRSVHAAFLLSQLTISAGLIGLGKVGSAFLRVVHSQLEELRVRYNCDLRIRAITDMKRMVLSDDPIDLSRWETILNEQGVEMNLEELAAHVRPCHVPHSIIIDCTPSDSIASQHATWLLDGIHIVSNNIKSMGSNLASYHELLNKRQQSNSSYQYETTVGGGLPVLMTLHSLYSSGDVPYRIEGVIGAFLSRVFNAISPIEGDKPPLFSEVCVQAASEGLFDTQNPIQQLSGNDVARRLLVLGRELGMELELSDVDVESFIPNLTQNSSFESTDGHTISPSLLQLLQSQDESLAKLSSQARQSSCVLRYTATVDTRNGEVSAKLMVVPFKDSLASLEGASYCVRYITKRMSKATPLVLKGPVGGPEAIAAALFADLIRVARDLGARDKGHRHIMKSVSFQNLNNPNL